MNDEIIIKILSKAKQLGTFSYGSLGNKMIKEDEFHSICSALCEINVLRKIQHDTVYATGGRGNSIRIPFESEVEYSLIISKEECQAKIDMLYNKNN